MTLSTEEGIAGAIQKKYDRHDQKNPTDCWVLDRRNGNLSGPYWTAEEAVRMALSLNDYVKRHKGLGAPFSAHSLDGKLIGGCQ